MKWNNIIFFSFVSIFHLLAISCDRLWAVTTVDYIHRRKAKHVCAGIAIIWLFSAIISLGPMLGWKDNEFEQRIVERKECMISQDISYQIFATIASFYAPSILLLLQYYRYVYYFLYLFLILEFHK